jgi:hypothetical protein
MQETGYWFKPIQNKKPAQSTEATEKKIRPDGMRTPSPSRRFRSRAGFAIWHVIAPDP